VGQGSGGLGSSPPENRDRWSWLYGLCCGVAGAASAAVLDHTWLKQYTAEAFVAVALALLLARVERSWSWRSLAAYAGAGIAGFLASNTAPLVSAAGLVTLARLGLGRRAVALLAVAGLLVVAVLLVPGRVRAGRGDIPGDDVKAQVADVLARSRPGDAVVVTFGATFVPTTVNAAVSFMPTFPAAPSSSWSTSPGAAGPRSRASTGACGWGRAGSGWPPAPPSSWPRCGAGPRGAVRGPAREGHRGRRRRGGPLSSQRWSRWRWA
jgi:uncharacterized low-complexity protein